MIGKKEFTAEPIGLDMLRIRGNCVFTGEPHEIVVPAEGLRRWQAGEPIQAAMPGVSRADREFLISGISPKGWESRFGRE